MSLVATYTARVLTASSPAVLCRARRPKRRPRRPRPRRTRRPGSRRAPSRSRRARRSPAWSCAAPRPRWTHPRAPRWTRARSAESASLVTENTTHVPASVREAALNRRFRRRGGSPCDPRRRRTRSCTLCARPGCPARSPAFAARLQVASHERLLQTTARLSRPRSQPHTLYPSTMSVGGAARRCGNSFLNVSRCRASARLRRSSPRELLLVRVVLRFAEPGLLHRAAFRSAFRSGRRLRRLRAAAQRLVPLHQLYLRVHGHAAHLAGDARRRGGYRARPGASERRRRRPCRRDSLSPRKPPGETRASRAVSVTSTSASASVRHDRRASRRGGGPSTSPSRRARTRTPASRSSARPSPLRSVSPSRNRSRVALCVLRARCRCCVRFREAYDSRWLPLVASMRRSPLDVFQTGAKRPFGRVAR